MNKPIAKGSTMNNIDPNATPGRSAIEREYDAIVALAIAHPDTEVISTTTAAGHLPDVSNSKD
jgi:hypothetical protein